MRKLTTVSLFCVSFLLSTLSTVPSAQADSPKTKEWTFLVYLNGNNNLDSFGKFNLNQMETVGSTDDLNILVQWASLANGKTERLYITKDSDTTQVTSPVVQDMGKVDMGDWHSVVNFVQWAVANYPAKHYFLTIWNHGSGWHNIQLDTAGGTPLVSPMDISWDDTSGHHITTRELGQALNESAKVIGHKLDVYGSDACLMAMVEVANEVAGSVDVFVGSEEVEPGEGWPYDSFLKQWAEKPTMTGAQLGKALTEDYVNFYLSPDHTREVTFSAFDMSQLANLNTAIAGLGTKLTALDVQGHKQVMDAIGKTQTFYTSDYGDLVDFLTNLSAQKVMGLAESDVASVRDAANSFVIANGTTSRYAKAKGVAIWLPSYQSSFSSREADYKALRFYGETHWGDALKSILKDTDSHPSHSLLLN